MASLICCKLVQYGPALPVVQIQILSSNLHYLIQRLMCRDSACQHSFLKRLFLSAVLLLTKDARGRNSNYGQIQFVSHPEDRLPAPGSEKHHAGFASAQTGGPNPQHCLSTGAVAVATAAAAACTLWNVCPVMSKAGDLKKTGKKRRDDVWLEQQSSSAAWRRTAVYGLEVRSTGHVETSSRPPQTARNGVKRLSDVSF